MDAQKSLAGEGGVCGGGGGGIPALTGGAISENADEVCASEMGRRLRVVVSGGTGYMGRRLIAELIARGHDVTALVRAGSEGKVPAGAKIFVADVFDAESFVGAVPAGAVFVHLTGVAHPAPWKEREFRAVDLASLRASAIATARAEAGHFVYVSVAHPAPVMKAYIRVRRECESILDTFGLARTILRPWYVVGPGHRWPQALSPLYRLFEAWGRSRESALRLGTVTIDEMTKALVWAVEQSPVALRVVDVPGIREAGRRAYSVGEADRSGGPSASCSHRGLRGHHHDRQDPFRQDAGERVSAVPATADK